MNVELTQANCYAAGRDAANRQMRKAGRTTWSRDDYNTAVRVCNELYLKTIPAEQRKEVARLLAA